MSWGQVVSFSGPPKKKSFLHARVVMGTTKGVNDLLAGLFGFANVRNVFYGELPVVRVNDAQGCMGVVNLDQCVTILGMQVSRNLDNVANLHF